MTEDLFPSPHPLTPPHHEEEWLSWIRLLRSRRVGPATFRRLLIEHGTAAAALAELPAVARGAGVKDYQVFSETAARAELKAARLAGVKPVALGTRAYPALLGELSDAPPMLWAIGDIDLLKRPLVAIVGARNASSLGTRMARHLAEGLGKADYVVVSGLARGIDTSAHLGAIQTGTIAVMAGGVDVVYPAENAVLAQEIAETGLRLSEQPMGLRPHARHFPQRNRIISGLCRGVVVVEAAARSGSLITSRYAADQGRDVLAVPGHPLDGRASGANMLIRDGATLVRSAQDIIDAFAAPAVDHPVMDVQTSKTTEIPPGPPERDDDMTALHGEILSRLGPSPVSEDQLIRDLERRAADVGPALVNLELDGKIIRQAGGLLSLSVMN